MRDLFHNIVSVDDVKSAVLSGEGGNFCSGGDVHDIIGPLTELDIPGLLAVTRLTGDVVKNWRFCFPAPGLPVTTWAPVLCCRADKMPP